MWRTVRTYKAYREPITVVDDDGCELGVVVTATWIDLGDNCVQITVDEIEGVPDTRELREKCERELFDLPELFFRTNVPDDDGDDER